MRVILQRPQRPTSSTATSRLWEKRKKFTAAEVEQAEKEKREIHQGGREDQKQSGHVGVLNALKYHNRANWNGSVHRDGGSSGVHWTPFARYDTKDEQRYADLDQLQFAAREAVPPLQRLETALHPWLGFLIMPVFALANARLPLEASGVSNRVAFATAFGLAIGKPVGMLLLCWLAIRLGLTALPEGERLADARRRGVLDRDRVHNGAAG